MDRYQDLENDMKSLSEFTTRKKSVDFAGFIALNEKGQEVFTFGKNKNQLVEEVLEREPGYYGWIQGADFPLVISRGGGGRVVFITSLAENVTGPEGVTEGDAGRQAEAR